jgi:hypothetical protein
MKKFLRNSFYAVILSSLVMMPADSPKRAEAAGPIKEIEKLTPPRTAVCFFDGEQVSDLVVNARGKLTFIYVDGKLAEALSRQQKLESNQGASSGIPPQIFAYAAKAKSKKQRVLFVARVQAMKGWQFDPAMISVGGYSPTKEDIITGVAGNPSTELRYGVKELQKGYDGFVGFFVPAGNVKPGTETAVGYGNDSAAWTAPDKNQ